MNPVSVIRDFLHAAPFAPFDIRLSDGRAWRITHPDFVMISGRGRVIIEGETEDVYANVSPMHITSVERVRASA
jgi:hypothetical protein